MPLPSFTNKTDLVDIIYAADVNNLQNEVAPTAAASAHVRYSTSYTSTTSVTLADTDMPIQSINFTGAGNFVLPAISTANHPFYLVNRSTSITSSVTFSGSTLNTLPPGFMGIAYSDSTASWKMLTPTPYSLGAAITGLTADSTPDLSADYIPSYDTSASAAKKVLMSNFRMAHSNNTVTTSNLTATLNTHHHLTIAGLTANRNFILPAPTATGQKIGVSIADGDDTYFVIIIGDTGIKINEGSTATEFHRLQTKGKTLTFRATSTTNWECVSGIETATIQPVQYSAFQPYSATSGAGFCALPKQPFILKDVSVLTSVATTNDGTNYWTITMEDTAGGSNVFSFNTSAHSAGAYVITLPTPSKTAFTTSDKYFLAQAVKVSLPGNIFVEITCTIWLC